MGDRNNKKYPCICRIIFVDNDVEIEIPANEKTANTFQKRALPIFFLYIYEKNPIIATVIKNTSIQSLILLTDPMTNLAL